MALRAVSNGTAKMNLVPAKMIRPWDDRSLPSPPNSPASAPLTGQPLPSGRSGLPKGPKSLGSGEDIDRLDGA